MIRRYNALVSLALPVSLPDLPFYNLSINVEGDNIGSSFANHIAATLFKNFEELWGVNQLNSFIKDIGYKELRSCLKIKILDYENGMNKVNDGAEEVGHSTVYSLIDLIKGKVGSNYVSS